MYNQAKIIFVFCMMSSLALLDGVHLGNYHEHPYAFGYAIKDHHGAQFREETGSGGHVVKGSYGFVDDRGIHRHVGYIADHDGFRAEVETNEPGTANQNPASAKFYAPYHYYGHGGYGHGGFGHGYGHGYGGHGYYGHG